MAAIDCTLGLDMGTSSLKGALLGRDGSLLATRTAEYSFSSPESGWAEIDPAAWEGAARQVVAELLTEVPEANILGIGLDGNMHGLVLLDHEGEALGPAMLWPDTRASEELALWEAAPADAIARLGNPLAPGMTGPMLVWVKHNRADLFANAASFVAPKDWLRSRLVPTEATTDPSDASATLLWDVIADDWHYELLEHVGIPSSLLPALLPSDSAAGVLDAQHAASWGLPKGIPVAVGSGDVAATLRGLRTEPGTLSLIIGTGVQGLVPQTTPSVSHVVTHHTFRASDDSYFALAAPMNGGMALQRAGQLLRMDWPELYASCSVDIPDDSCVFLPYFTGERLPQRMQGGKAGWHGLGLTTDRTTMARTAVEGMLFGLKRAVDELPASHGPLSMVGGGSRSRDFQQLAADILGRPIVRRGLENVTAIGAALLGWAVAGVTDVPVVEPAGERSEARVDPALEARYRRFLAATDELFV